MRARKQLMELVEETDLPNRRQVQDGQAKLDNAQERALKIMTALSELYQWQENGKARQIITQEFEQLVEEFEEPHNRGIWMNEMNQNQVRRQDLTTCKNNET